MLYARSRCEELFEGVYIQNGDIIAKTCTKCGKLLYIDDFLDGKSKNRYGYKTCDRCRECKAKWRANNPEKVKESKAKWKANNPEKVKESKAKWKANNPEKVKESRAKWKANNPEKMKGYFAEWNKKQKSCFPHQDKNKRFIDTAMKYLTPEEQPEIDEEGYLTVLCKLCKVRFRPTFGAIHSRLTVLKGNVHENSVAEHSLYCSQECKDHCPLYLSKGADPNTKHESLLDDARSEEWAEEVKRRAGYVCQECGSTEGLQAHHIVPIAYDSTVFSADYDNGICLCHECHMKAHSSDGCRLGELAHVRKCA